MEKILSIEEIEDVEFEALTYNGFEIKTDKHTYQMLIGNYQNCCENWGYLLTEDNLNEFIGAEIIDIHGTDAELNTKTIQWKKDNKELFEDAIVFVTFDTTEGSLQFVAYNQHNGYYSHSVLFLKDNTCIDSERL